MTARDIKSRLLAVHMPEADVEIPGVGTVRVRGLSRAEVLAFDDSLDPAATDRALLAIGMVKPRLTEAEVEIWQTTSITGEIEAIADRIMVLSGLRKDSAKRAYKEFEADPGSEFRLPAGERSGDDGSAARSGDE